MARESNLDRWLRLAPAGAAGPVDAGTGAPANVRIAVGNAVTDRDRLATLRGFYPDAEPIGDGNFIFTDPETGRRRLYNPRGLDTGDLASVAAPAAAQMLGGAVGGILALPSAAALGPAGPAAGVGLGAAAGQQLLDAYMRNVMGTVDTRSLVERFAGAGADVGLNAIGGPLAERAMQAISAAVAPARYAGNAVLEEAGQRVRDAAARLGIEIPAGVATGSKTVQQIESTLAQSPGGAGATRAAYDESLAAADRIARQAAERIAPGGRAPLTAGATDEAARIGARRGGEDFARRAGELREQALDLIGRDRPLRLTEIAREGATLARDLARAPESLDASYREATDRAIRLLNDLDRGGGSLPVGTVVDVRRAIGAALDAPQAAGQVAPEGAPALRRIYAALNRELDAAAREAGPDAADAWRRSNRFVEAYRREGGPGATVEAFGVPGSAESITQAFLAGERRGVRELAQLRGRMRREDWDATVAGVLTRLGRARPGAQNEAGDVFSLETFLTNWNNLGRDGRRVLLGGSRYARSREALDDLATVAGGFRDAGRTRGFSNTGSINAYNALLASLVAGAVEPMAGGLAVGTMGAFAGGARLLQSPRVIRALANLGRSAGRSDAIFTRELGRLGTILAADDVPEDVRAFLTPALTAAQRALVERAGTLPPPPLGIPAPAR